MRTIQVRLSDQEEAALQERVRLTGLSISSLGRLRDDPEIALRRDLEGGVVATVKKGTVHYFTAL